MMQLLCNGTCLDLGGGQKVTFQKSNPLFAFDSLKCERTTEFSLPDTPTNNRVFELAKKPEYNGHGMMVRYDAEMQVGHVVKKGWLYVSRYDFKSKAYFAVFVTGQLTQLKAAKDAGNLSEIFDETTMGETALFNRVASYNINSAMVTSDYVVDDYDEGNQYYERPRGMVAPRYPAINFAYLFQKCCSHFGIVANSPVVGGDEGFFLVPPKLVSRTGGDAMVGDTVRMVDNLPDVTFIDLVKTWAAMTGTLINVEGNVITFETCNDVETWDRIEARDIIAFNQITRTFLNYGQRNIVKEKGERLEAAYTISNLNIKEENVLQDVPFDFGDETFVTVLQTDTTSKPMFVAPANRWAIAKKVSTNPSTQQEDLKVTSFLHSFDSTLVVRSTGYVSANKTNIFPKNAFLQQLCDKSTEVSVNMRMTLADFESLDAKTTILVQGTIYVWTEATWNDGVAKLTLSKV